MTETMTTFTTDELFSLLARSGLLNDRLLEEQRQKFQGQDQTPKSILSEMLAQHLITPFQARQLGERRHRGFFLSEKYKILEFLGQGGMSRVLLCEHMLLQRLVAVKILNKSLDKFPGAAERFLREARASASMDHPNIARVFDVDRTGLGPCIVMEYVDGTNLHDMTVKRDLLSVSRVANYISQAATGLQQAHLAGLVHRDIKPANLMLDRTGTVKLLDLGLARFFDPTRSDNLTQQIDTSCIIGTADYIAPEQVMESSSADIRADIYSLGYTMYFLLTKTFPAGTGPAMRKLLWHQTREPEPVRNLRPEVPEDLAMVLERMIKKKPEDRYQNPTDVIAALAPWTTSAIDRPSDEEMPRVRASAYRLGLCPPPDSSKLAGASSSNKDNKSIAQSTSKKGSSSANQLPEIETETQSRDYPASMIGYTNAQDAEGFSEGSSLLRSAKTHEVMSVATETDSTSGSSFTRRLADSAIVARRFTRRHILSLLGMIATFVFGALGTVWWLNGIPQFLESSLNSVSPHPQIGTTRVSTSEVKAEPTSPIMASAGIVLRGGGSTFVRPIMEYWGKLYEKQSGVKIEYTAVGSSKGIDGLISRFVDFGCTDTFMSDEQLMEAGTDIVHIPLVVGAVVPTYNVPSETDERFTIRFTGPMLANIYLGKIKKWNDPAIVVNNPGRDLPDLDITVVYRKDGSGTTAIWTDYLSKTSSAWKNLIGSGGKVKFPVGLAAEKNDGIADTVSRTVGALGYVELGFAVANSLSVGQVKNQSGAFVEPSVDAITAAATASAKTIPIDLRYSLTDAIGPSSYPIVGTSWAVIHVNQPSDRGTALVSFLKWAISEGQLHVANFQYGRLPKEIAEKAAAQLDRIAFSQ